MYLEIHFNPDPRYRVIGSDLYVELPVAPWEAALGATVKFPTPAGPIMLKIPETLSQGRELRIKGRGIPSAKPGDLYAVLKIVLPPADTEKARQIYADMARELAFNPRSSSGVSTADETSGPVVRAELVDTATLCTVEELCLACNVEANWITELVEHGVIEAIGQVSAEWRFTSLTIVRIAKAKRLERDLNLNVSGLAVVLDLLDEIDDLRAQLGKIPRFAK